MPLRRPVAALFAFATAAGCARSQVTTTSDIVPQPPVVTLTARGAEPQQLHLFTHEGITFINQDGRGHQIQVDPTRSTDPACTAIGVGALATGEQRTSELLPGNALCWYADAADPADPRWQGVVVTH